MEECMYMSEKRVRQITSPDSGCCYIKDCYSNLVCKFINYLSIKQIPPLPVERGREMQV